MHPRAGPGDLVDVHYALGRFELPRVTRDCRWRVSVTADGYGFAETEVEISGLTDEVEVLLQDAAPVVLRVLDEDGRGLSHVEIALLDEDGRTVSRQSYQPDQEGRLVLRNLVPGRRRLHVFDLRANNTTVEIEVPGPEVTVVLGR